jgi:hypothetical protein
MLATELVKLHRLSPERQLTALAMMNEAATTSDLGLEGLRTAIDRQMAVAERLRGLQATWDRQRGAGATRAVAEVLASSSDLVADDAAVDAAIGRLHRKLVADLAAYGDEEPEGQLARRLLEAAFPIGLSGHVKAPFAEQRTHNAVLAALLRSEAWAADIEAARLGPILRPMLAAIDHFELRYAAARREAGELSWADLRAAAAEAHEGLCVLVAHALVAAEGDPALAQRLLRPILEEQAATRRRVGRGGGEPDAAVIDAEVEAG